MNTILNGLQKKVKNLSFKFKYNKIEYRYSQGDRVRVFIKSTGHLGTIFSYKPENNNVSKRICVILDNKPDEFIFCQNYQVFPQNPNQEQEIRKRIFTLGEKREIEIIDLMGDIAILPPFKKGQVINPHNFNSCFYNESITISSVKISDSGYIYKGLTKDNKKYAIHIIYDKNFNISLQVHSHKDIIECPIDDFEEIKTDDQWGMLRIKNISLRV